MHDAFSRPINVLVGLGFPRRIRGAGDAIAYLEQHAALRDEAYEATLDACRAALSGQLAIDEACDIFMGFARRRQVLVDEALPETMTGDLPARAAA